MPDSSRCYSSTSNPRIEVATTTRPSRTYHLRKYDSQIIVRVLSVLGLQPASRISYPVCSAYRHFEKWTQEYGPVFSLRQGFNTVIIIGRLQAAIDVMEKEGAFTVDRPHNISAGEVLSGGMRMLLTPAGERFKKMRRYVTFNLIYRQDLIRSIIAVHCMPIYSPRSFRTTVQLLCGMLNNIFLTSSIVLKGIRTMPKGPRYFHYFMSNSHYTWISGILRP